MTTEAGLFTEEGLWWPRGCAGKTDRYLRHQHDSGALLKLLPKGRRRTVIQAGGHNGLWALRLATKFRTVYTFEPAADNFECLTRNCQHQDNIFASQALLGDRRGTGQLLFNASNAGGHKCTFDHHAHSMQMEEMLAGHRKYAPGDVLPVVAIDDLKLDDVDAIILDIEGAEPLAFRGAAETIKRCKPILMYEERGHSEVHGITPREAEKWLIDQGYQFHSRKAKDRIWVPRGSV